ncbi:hypothetical protein MTO96_041708 [Rhipicephalus appendiculatus]
MITSARQNVPFAEDRIPRRTERAKNAFKFLTSCDGEDDGAESAPKDSAAGPGEPVTGFQRVKYSQAGAFRHASWPPEQQLQGPLSLPGADPERAYLGGSCQAEVSGAATRGNSGTIARA